MQNSGIFYTIWHLIFNDIVFFSVTRKERSLAHSLFLNDKNGQENSQDLEKMGRRAARGRGMVTPGSTLQRGSARLCCVLRASFWYLCSSGSFHFLILNYFSSASFFLPSFFLLLLSLSFFPCLFLKAQLLPEQSLSPTTDALGICPCSK